VSGRAQGVPVEVHSPEDLRRIAIFRTEVWMADGFVQPDELVDGVYPIPDDALCRHWVIEENGRIVAAGRLSVHESVEEVQAVLHWEGELGDELLRPACLTRLIVHSSARHHGFACALDRVRIEAARRTGCRVVFGLPIGKRRAAALGDLGFRKISEATELELKPYGVQHGQPLMLLPL
jgi:hypothetical protein